jgi:hypothetical protein
VTIEVVPLTAEALVLVARGIDVCTNRNASSSRSTNSELLASRHITDTCRCQRVKHVDIDPARLTPVALPDGNWKKPEDRDD